MPASASSRCDAHPATSTPAHGGYPGLADRGAADARCAQRRRAGAGSPLGSSRPRTASATASSWSGSTAKTLGARIVRDASLAAIRPKLAEQCGEILGAHPRHRSCRRPASPRASNRLSPEQSVRADLGALSGIRHAATDDRLRRPLAARTSAAQVRADAGAQRLPQRQPHGVGRTVSLPCSTGRSPTSAIPCATSAGSARTPGASAAASCRSVASAPTRTCCVATSGCRARQVAIPST